MSEVSGGKVENWYYVISGQKLGPESSENLIEWVSSGTLSLDNLVWRTGMADWLPIRDTELIPNSSDTPPPLSGEHVNNTAVWLWAFAPLIPINAILVAGNIPGTSQSMLLWSIGLAINMMFWMLDGHQLQRAGHNREGWGGWGIFVVPVYLFIRAAKLKQSNGYAIVWLVCLGLSIFGHGFI
jgi:hypothetical protein